MIIFDRSKNVDPSIVQKATGRILINDQWDMDFADKYPLFMGNDPKDMPMFRNVIAAFYTALAPTKRFGPQIAYMRSNAQISSNILHFVHHALYQIVRSAEPKCYLGVKNSYGNMVYHPKHQGKCPNSKYKASTLYDATILAILFWIACHESMFNYSITATIPSNNGTFGFGYYGFLPEYLPYPYTGRSSLHPLEQNAVMTFNIRNYLSYYWLKVRDDEGFNIQSSQDPVFKLMNNSDVVKMTLFYMYHARGFNASASGKILATSDLHDYYLFLQNFNFKILF